MSPFPEYLAAIIRGDALSWNDVGVSTTELIQACMEQEVATLVHERIGKSFRECPEEVSVALGQSARAAAAVEILRQIEITAAIEALARAGIKPVMLKGTPIAYTSYRIPSARPRNDTDLIVREPDVEAARQVLAQLGYAPTPHCDDLFSQFEVQKRDALGIAHVFDVHWRISTQTAFATFLTYDELSAHAERVPALGNHARAAGRLHALLLACVHPVMHHQNIERLLWIYDIHLLASALRDADWGRFVELAREKRMTAVCARGLRLARTYFRATVADPAIAQLMAGNGNEPSAEYLEANRRWHDELVSSLGQLPGWRPRLLHLREVLFPSANYMLATYGLQRTLLAPALLPALYLHRNVNGAWKILIGRK